jgi:hypothetical protein
MVKVALFVRLEAKPGKEADVESFLRGGLPIVQKEPATIAWFGIRLGPTASSTPLRTRRDGKRTFRDKSRPH